MSRDWLFSRILKQTLKKEDGIQNVRHKVKNSANDDRCLYILTESTM